MTGTANSNTAVGHPLPAPGRPEGEPSDEVYPNGALGARTLPLIRSKLSPARASGAVIPRIELLQRLTLCQALPVIVIRAPAGYGKTSVLSQWHRSVATTDAHAAWCSLDASDDAEGTFLHGVVEALLEAGCAIRAGTHVVEEEDPRAIRKWVATLLNELQAIEEEVFLFLDDFHCLTRPGIHAAARDLIRYAPHNLHLVLGSRTLPDLGLRELEVEEKVAIFDVDAIRFSEQETRSFLHTRLVHPLEEVDLQRLHECTRGWPAGLQLAALSLNKGARLEPVVAPRDSRENEFDAYFAESVIQRFPEDVRRFLILTSVLARFDAGLADAILGRSDSHELLRRLDQDNVFLIRLAGEGGWHQYHPLFESFLRSRFEREFASDREQIFRAASLHCERTGEMILAVQYALAAAMPGRAAELVERCALDLVQSGEIKACTTLIERLPPADAETRPILRIAQAWALVLSNQPERVRTLLPRIEAEAERSTVQREHSLLLRGLCELFEGADTACATTTKQWDKTSPKVDAFLTSVGCNLLSMTRCQQGDFEGAREAQVLPRRWSDPERSLYATCYANCLVAYSYARRGAMKVAEPAYRAELQRANQQAGRRSAPACTTASFFGEVLYETGQLDALADLLADRMDVIEEVALPDALFQTFRARARLLMSRGEISQAQATLEHLQLRAQGRGHDHVLAACLLERAVLHASLGEWQTVEHLETQLQTLAADSAVRERCNASELDLLLASLRLRLTVHRKGWSWALDQCHALARQACNRQRGLERIRFELIRGRILESMGRLEEALTVLGAQLRESEYLGAIRVFVDEWPECRPLMTHPELSKAARWSAAHLERVKHAFGALQDSAIEGKGVRFYSGAGLVEDLSERECQILKLLGQGLQNKQIAGRLNVSINTVKWHLKNAYAKLDVAQRGKAVIKARELGLV